MDKRSHQDNDDGCKDCVGVHDGKEKKTSSLEVEIEGVVADKEHASFMG